MICPNGHKQSLFCRVHPAFEHTLQIGTCRFTYAFYQLLPLQGVGKITITNNSIVNEIIAPHCRTPQTRGISLLQISYKMPFCTPQFRIAPTVGRHLLECCHDLSNTIAQTPFVFGYNIGGEMIDMP